MARPTGSYVTGILLILIGLLLLIDRLDLFRFTWRTMYPVLVLSTGLLFLVLSGGTRNRGAIFSGSVLTVLGVFFVLRNYRLLTEVRYLEGWAVFLVSLGIGFLVLYVLEPKDWGLLVPGGILLFIGGTALLEQLGVIDWRTWEQIIDFWPVILILIGAKLLYTGLRKQAGEEQPG
jgi:hypothetical protein